MELRYELESTNLAPGAARSAIERDLAGRLDPEALDSVKLIVSELVMNSVMYGPGEPIHLDMTLDPSGGVRGEVADQGDGVVEIRREAEDGPGGRGLRIVDALSSKWGVYEGSTHVWFELSS